MNHMGAKRIERRGFRGEEKIERAAPRVPPGRRSGSAKPAPERHQKNCVGAAVIRLRLKYGRPLLGSPC